MIFSKTEEQAVVRAIKAAETKTSGEVRVFIEEVCDAEHPLERAAVLFQEYEMTNTRERNGVLLYIATASRQFAIWGDSGIHQRLGQQFWEAEKHLLRQFLQQDKACEGVCAVISKIGDALKTHFPAHSNDNPNELPDDIIYG